MNRPTSFDMTNYYLQVLQASVNKEINFIHNKNLSTLSCEELKSGQLETPIFTSILTHSRKKDIKAFDVIIVGKTVTPQLEQGQEVKTAFGAYTGLYYIPATLKDDNKLYPSYPRLPWIPREFLFPISEPAISIGSSKVYDESLMDQLYSFMTCKNWETYYQLFSELFYKVNGTSFLRDTVLLDGHSSRKNEIKVENTFYLFKDERINAIKSISSLYEKILINFTKNSDEKKKLYETLFSPSLQTKNGDTPRTLSTMKEHSGQMGGSFSLSPSQRNALNHFNETNSHEILAINGPPGTGKTTLIQTIVADLFVKHALQELSPPLIVATSTNNQAITNIIDSFGTLTPIGLGNIEKRWLEKITSFAVYFPSTYKMMESVEKGYQCTQKNGSGFINNVMDTSENITASKKFFLKNFNEFWFDSTHVKTISRAKSFFKENLSHVDTIKKIILEFMEKILKYEDKSKEILILEKKLHEIKEFENNCKLTLATYSNRLAEWEIHFNHISKLDRLFSFIPFFKNRISEKNEHFLNDEEHRFLNASMDFPEIKDLYLHKINLLEKDIEAKRDQPRIHNIVNEIALFKQFEKEHMTLLDDYNKAIVILADVLYPIKEKIILAFDITPFNPFKSIREFDEKIDTTLRYIEFWLAVHYFECSWLENNFSLSEKQKDKTHRNVIEKRYQRLSLICPCFVMTFYRLPENFKAYNQSQSGEYLFNQIDLLIVDEAGQVAPEIASATFSLAKKALVVGDIHQISPVYSIDPPLDFEFATQNFDETINKREYYQYFKDELKFSSSNSSLMEIAQKSCLYSTELAPQVTVAGLFLSEHRRCYNEIISFSNNLVYHGQLKPLRGFGYENKNNPLTKLNIPSMGYIQVNTEKSSINGTSRYNQQEVDAMLGWLTINYTKLQNSYPNVATESLIGIITPFKAQSEKIKTALKDSEFKDIPVGTIHTFQGSEKQIILMSTVYGQKDGCFFIDKNPNLLNVAVSRAKDSFLVFSDTRSLESSANGNLLMEHLSPF